MSLLKISPYLLRIIIGTLLCLLLTQCRNTSPFNGRTKSGATTAYADQRNPQGQNPYHQQRASNANEAQQGNSTSRRNPDIYLPRVLPPGAQSSYSRVSTAEPLIAMTFDDGPHPVHTPRLLNYLAARNIKATFYVIGKNVRQYPHIVRRMITEGHEVGNHTMTHRDLSKLSDYNVKQDLAQTSTLIEKTIGVRPRTMRPPYGAFSTRQRKMIRSSMGLPTILWSVDPRDWTKPGRNTVIRRLVQGARNGGILLAHDIHSQTVDAMPGALDSLLGKGFKFVTVTQLIQAAENKGPTRAPNLHLQRGPSATHPSSSNNYPSYINYPPRQNYPSHLPPSPTHRGNYTSPTLQLPPTLGRGAPYHTAPY